MRFSDGVRDGFPIGLGYFAVSFSFGIAGSKLISWPLVTFISMTNLTSAGQFAGLQIMSDAAGTFIEMAIATFFMVFCRPHGIALYRLVFGYLVWGYLW